MKCVRGNKIILKSYKNHMGWYSIKGWCQTLSPLKVTTWKRWRIESVGRRQRYGRQRGLILRLKWVAVTHWESSRETWPSPLCPLPWSNLFFFYKVWQPPIYFSSYEQFLRRYSPNSGLLNTMYNVVSLQVGTCN